MTPTQVTSRIRFKCACGVQLEAKTKLAGLVRECPACKQDIEVPLVLAPLPQPMPNMALDTYVGIAAQIADVTMANCTILRRLNRRSDFKSAKKDGKRAIHNALSFATHAIESAMKHRSEDDDLQSQVNRGLSEVVLSQEFQGPGTRAERRKRREQLKRWLAESESNVNFAPYTSVVEFIRERQTEIRQLRFDVDEAVSSNG